MKPFPYPDIKFDHFYALLKAIIATYKANEEGDLNSRAIKKNLKPDDFKELLGDTSRELRVFISNCYPVLYEMGFIDYTDDSKNYIAPTNLLLNDFSEHTLQEKLARLSADQGDISESSATAQKAADYRYSEQPDTRDSFATPHDEVAGEGYTRQTDTWDDFDDESDRPAQDSFATPRDEDEGYARQTDTWDDFDDEPNHLARGRSVAPYDEDGDFFGIGKGPHVTGKRAGRPQRLQAEAEETLPHEADEQPGDTGERENSPSAGTRPEDREVQDGFPGEVIEEENFLNIKPRTPPVKKKTRLSQPSHSLPGNQPATTRPGGDGWNEDIPLPRRDRQPEKTRINLETSPPSAPPSQLDAISEKRHFPRTRISQDDFSASDTSKEHPPKKLGRLDAGQAQPGQKGQRLTAGYHDQRKRGKRAQKPEPEPPQEQSPPEEARDIPEKDVLLRAHTDKIDIRVALSPEAAKKLTEDDLINLAATVEELDHAFSEDDEDEETNP